MDRKVFICYESTTGQSYAEHLKKALERIREDEYEVFLSDLSLRGGCQWEQERDHALEECNFFIIIITALTMDSVEVKKEYDIACDLKKRVIPARYSKILVNETKELSRLQQLEFSDKYDLANKIIIELRNINKQKLIKLEKDSNEFFKRGNLLFNLKMYQQALQLYEQAICLRVYFPEAWANIGLIYSILHKYKEALKAFEKAINLYPNFADAWLDKGIILNKLNKPQDALYAFERAIEIDPDFAEAWGAKGSILGILENHKEALIAFKNKIILNPDDYEMWTLKGYTLFKLNRYDEAEKACDVALTLKSDFADVLYLKACLYSYKNDKKNTILFLSKAIKLDKTYKKEAKEDKDFMNFWKDDDFLNITRIDDK